MKRNFNNVCITGSGNGIGKAISVLLNKHGYNVACVDINLEDAKNTINEFENKVAKSIAIYADISNVSHIKKMIKEVVCSFGSLHIMINNAGVTRTSDIMKLKEQDWYWINNINSKGTFFCLQAAANQMKLQKSGGRIINMSSIGARGFVDVSNAIYAGSKGAILSLTKTAAQQLGKFNINVNAICPSPTCTEIVKKLIKTRALEQNKPENEIMKHYMRDVPLGRFNQPEDIAELALFLSSESSKNISGQSFNVDGGLIPS